MKMGKASPKGRQSNSSKGKKKSNNSNKYLKPGALAQLRNAKMLAAKPRTDIGKQRVAMVELDKENVGLAVENNIISRSPSMLSPMKYEFTPASGPKDLFKQDNLQKTPRTPCFQEFHSGSRLESLPMDLLVNILCYLHHDQLKAVFHVSQNIRKAVILARQFHFNYTTPDRSRQEILGTMTPHPISYWPFARKGDGNHVRIPSPITPKAPRQGPRPLSRVKFTEMRHIAAVLFEKPALPSRCFVPSVLSKPLCKTKPLCKALASNRVLFYEDELCQAVAQNKLL